MLRWASSVLCAGGRLLLECRTKGDPLYGLGRRISSDEFVYGHYRRFLDTTLLDRIVRAGFTVTKFVAGKGFAPHGEEDPIIMRVAAQKGTCS